MKTKTALLLILLIFLLSHPGTAAENFDMGDGSFESPYEIRTVEQLKLLNEEEYSDQFFILANDLEIQEAEWTPIGSQNRPFTGSFDGNGKTILFSNPDGVHFVKSDADMFHDAYGLFGNVENSMGQGYCEFKNIRLVFAGEIQNADTNGKHLRNFGGLIGNLSVTPDLRNDVKNRLMNCSVQGTGLTGGAYIGGMCGVVSYTVVDNCTAEINVISTAVTSESSNLITNGTGGLIGLSTESRISNSSASGNVQGEQRLGGLIGSLGISEIENCFATGNVRLTGTAKTAKHGGGLIGSIYNTKMTDCYATGDVTGNVGTVGGLCGSYTGQTDNYWEVEKCYASGSVEADQIAGGLIGWGSNIRISECFTTGDVTAYEKNAGGLIGYSNYTRIESSFSTGNVYANETAGGLCGYAEHTTVNISYATGDVEARSNTAGGLIGHGFYYTLVNNSSALNNHTTSPLNAGRVFGIAENSDAYYTSAWENMTNLDGGYGQAEISEDEEVLKTFAVPLNINGADTSSFDVWNSYPENELGRWDTVCWGESCWKLHDYTDFRLPVFQWQDAEFQADASHLNYTLPEESSENETPKTSNGGSKRISVIEPGREVRESYDAEKEQVLPIAGPAVIILLFMVAIAAFSYRRHSEKDE